MPSAAVSRHQSVNLHHAVARAQGHGKRGSSQISIHVQTIDLSQTFTLQFGSTVWTMCKHPYSSHAIPQAACEIGQRICNPLVCLSFGGIRLH